jgi:hypothetical protein
MSNDKPLSIFVKKLIEFLEELHASFPEEKELKMGLEYIIQAKSANPRLVHDYFLEYVYNTCSTFIYDNNMNGIKAITRELLSVKINQMLSVLSIFEKHWDTMEPNNQSVIWQYLKVLCKLSERVPMRH